MGLWKWTRSIDGRGSIARAAVITVMDIRIARAAREIRGNTYCWKRITNRIGIVVVISNDRGSGLRSFAINGRG